MPKNIVLAKLDVDTQSLITSAQKTAKELQNLSGQQEKLSRKGKESSEQFRANAAVLKSLTDAHKAQTDVIAAQSVTLDEQLKAASDYGKAELSLWREQNKSQLKSNTDRNQALTDEEKSYQSEQLKLAGEHQAQLGASEKERRNSEAEEKAQQYELDLATASSQKEEQKITEQLEYDAQKALLDARLNDQLMSRELYNEAITKMDDEAKEKDMQRTRDLTDFKLEQQSSLMADMAAILGKESKAGKAFSIAQTTIDTYLGAQKAYTSQLIPGDPSSIVRAAIAAGAAVAAGLKNVQKIAGVKDPKFEKGGLMSIGGNRHSTGGTLFTGTDGTRFEAEQGELIGVMNRNAAQHFMAFNNAFPAGSGASVPNYFAGGGIVSREIATQSINTDELALKIAEANRMLPPPVVAVQDIITQGDSYVRVMDAANF